EIAVFFFQAEDGIRGLIVTGVQTCALPISALGRQLRAIESWGVRYPSVRHAGGECVGIFRPRALRHAKSAAHLALHWDGARITRSEERRVGKECRSGW